MSAPWSATAPFDPEFEDLTAKGHGRTSPLAIVSLVAGIVGFVPIVGPLTAIVTGIVARGAIRSSRGRLAGAELATAGIALGVVWAVLTAVVLGGLLVTETETETATATATATIAVTEDRDEAATTEAVAAVAPPTETTIAPPEPPPIAAPAAVPAVPPAPPAP